tara:strand:+ start:159 stop:1079 length:921 start_codon:yes stop_codon:yes gene_type:complete
MILFLQATFQGLSLGAVYSLVAIGLVLIYKATDVLSFAQPALAVAGAGVISFLAVDRGLSFWIALPLGIFITGIFGLVIERTFLRAMVGEPVFSVAILTIGIDILIRTVLDDWIGLNPRYMGDSFSMMGNFGSLNIGGVSLKYLELTALVAAIFVIGLLTIFFKYSKYGLAMRAASFDQEASLAQGINVGRVIALVWFIAAMLASLSGFFITGGFNGLSQASFVTALRALPAIVIGGLDSLVGAVVGSLIVGLTQGYIAYYQISIENSIGISFGSGFSLLAPYLIMFVILIIRPDGLFGKEEVERV